MDLEHFSQRDLQLQELLKTNTLNLNLSSIISLIKYIEFNY